MKEEVRRNEKDDPQGKTLPEVMLPIIAQLQVDRKFAAAHVTGVCSIRSVVFRAPTFPPMSFFSRGC